MRGRAVVALATAAVVAGGGSAEAAESDVALVALIVVDQLGQTYLDRYGEYLTGGFARLMRGSAVYTRGQYRYANTETAPGHSTLATGSWPSVHGITGNGWYDPSGQPVYCFGDPVARRGPKNLRVATIADAVRISARGRAFSVALKDRAAIAMGGHRPDFVSWYGKPTGRFVTGSWKGASPAPAWFNEVALKTSAADAFGKTWNRLRNDLDYDAIAGKDDLPYEENVPGFGRTFPHVLGKGTDGPTSLLWRKRFPAAPHAMRALERMVIATLDNEKVGRQKNVDYLAIGISNLDYAGHHWGTSSHEVLDTLMRIDAMIGRIIDAIEKRVGEGRVLWVLTADHGATPTVEDSIRLGLNAGRVNPNEIKAAADGALAKRKKGMRLLEIDTPRLFLSPYDDPAERTAAARDVAKALAKLPYIEEAYASADLKDWPAPYGPLFRRSYFPGRDGDVYYRIRPNWYPADWNAAGEIEMSGTGHGSPYVYDSEVPIVLKGPGVRPGIDRRPYAMTRVAPTIAAVLGIQPPPAAHDAPLPAVTR